MNALRAEIEREPAFEGGTIFLGGGTPNTYDAKTIVSLIELLRARFGCSGETTIEVNPELVTFEALQEYARAGIDRLSIGVQSFADAEIATLGRRHTVADVRAAVEGARRAGTRSISLDLIFAIPGQTREAWRASLDTAVALGVDHLSLYGLTIEAGTPFAAWHARDPAVFTGDAVEADLYELDIDTLQRAGFEQYEVSNFARPGHRCAHNATYWRNEPYRGFGVGAASFREGLRWTQTRDFERYCDALERGTAVPREAERLTGAARAGEAVMLALRTAEGVQFSEFAQRYGIDFRAFYRPIWTKLAAAGFLEVNETSARLTKPGLMLANDVCGEFVTFA